MLCLPREREREREIPPIDLETKIMSCSSARRILQRRAIQCSFSSVFHLRNCCTPGKNEAASAVKEAKNAERIFFRAVAIPMYVMGFIGATAYGHRQ